MYKGNEVPKTEILDKDDHGPRPITDPVAIGLLHEHRQKKFARRRQFAALGLAVTAIGLGSLTSRSEVVCTGTQPAQEVTLNGPEADEAKATVEVPDGDWVAFDDMPGDVLRDVENEEGQLEQKRLPLDGTLYPGDVIVNLPVKCETE